jgi:hypothetical protein
LITVWAEIPWTAIAVLPVVTITFSTLGERTIRARPTVGEAVALPILTICKPRAIVRSLTLALIRSSLGIRWLRIGRQAGLGLKSRLWLLVRRPGPLRRRREAIRQAAEIAVVIHFVALAFSGRSRLTALCERLGSLRRGDKSEVMLGVLQIILGSNGIAPRVGVPREL